LVQESEPIQSAAHKALNLFVAAADRIAAEAPVPDQVRVSEKFPSDNNSQNARRNFRLAQNVVSSGGEPRNCAMQKLQLCDGFATPTLRSIIELKCSNLARRQR
jgi:hypothetical protein